MGAIFLPTVKGILKFKAQHMLCTMSIVNSIEEIGVQLYHSHLSVLESLTS